MGNHQSTYSVDGYESERPCSLITLRHKSDSNTSVGPHTHCHAITTNCDTFNACLKESHLSVNATNTFAPNETFWKCLNDGHHTEQRHHTEHHGASPFHPFLGREESRAPPTHSPETGGGGDGGGGEGGGGRGGGEGGGGIGPAILPGQKSTATYADSNNALRFMDL